jgi:hypothetical protein
MSTKRLAKRKKSQATFGNNDAAAIGAIASACAAAGSGSVALATTTVSTTVPAAGILGWLGFTTVATTTTTIGLPVAGIVAFGGFFAYGAWKVLEIVRKE